MPRPRGPFGRFDPPPAPDLAGPYAENARLDAGERWEIPDGIGPEAVAFDDEGNAYTGIEDGRILRFPPGGGRPETVAHTGGRPLGVEVDRDGTLVVCDPYRGLLRVDPATRQVDVLVDRFEGRPLLLCDNATIASDGTVYFTDSTQRWQLHEQREPFIEHDPTGRILAYDPDAGEARLVLEDLYFANGVALSRDEDFLAVAETARYQVTRLWLRGDRAGERDLLVDNLPGLPDNVTANGQGVFWVALTRLRDATLDRVFLSRPTLRKIVQRIPQKLQPDPDRRGMVVAVDERGQVVDNLQSPSGQVHDVTGAREHDGWLYVGSLEMDAVVRVRLR